MTHIYAVYNKMNKAFTNLKASFIESNYFINNIARPSGVAFLPVFDYAGKADLSKGYWNPKRKLRVTMHFSEITKQ